MVTYDKMSPEEEATYSQPGQEEEPVEETEEEMVQRLQAAGYTVSRQPQTPIERMVPQPKKETKVGTGVIRTWAKKEYADIKSYVKQKAAEKQAEKAAFAALPPEEQRRIKAERAAKLKGLFQSEEQPQPTMQSVQTGVMGQPIQPPQQGPSMSMIMSDMFGTNQQPPPPQSAYPSQSRARRRVPPAGPAPLARYGSVSAEPRYNTQQVIGSLFGEQAPKAPRRVRGVRSGMRVDKQGYGMYGAGATDMINRSFSFGPPSVQRTARKAVRHSTKRHTKR